MVGTLVNRKLTKEVLPRPHFKHDRQRYLNRESECKERDNVQGTRVKVVARGEYVEQTRCTTPLYAVLLVYFEKLVESVTFLTP